MKLKTLWAALAVASASVPAFAQAVNGQELLKSQCVACHVVAKPGTSSIDHVITRKGPDLHYAGVKFNREWLVAWLQNPAVIRQGGATYFKAVKPDSAGGPDTVDPSQVAVHPKLSAADAAAAADALMSLGLNDGLVQKGAYKGDPPGGMAPLLFNKLRGCASCHSAKPGSGGVSGPELYSAGTRLQADYVVEYIRNPQKFDPKVWMPKLDLNEGDIQKLTGYLIGLKQGGEK